MKPRSKQQPKTTKMIFTIPNILSAIRLCLIPLIVWLYSVEENAHLAGYVLILSGLTDIVDGFIARHFHMISDLGKILDPVADKLTQATMLVCLLSRFPLMIVPLLMMVLKETFVGITGALVIQKRKVVHGANWHGKVATCLLYGMMILHVFCPDISAKISMITIAASTIMIGISFYFYGSGNIKALKE